MYSLNIVTPEEVFFEQEVISIIAPGSEGYLGVLTDHAPLITALVPGKLTVKDDKERELILATSGGFMEVFKNHVTVLAHSVEFLDDIDYERAKRALERAERRVKSRDPAIDVTRAFAALERARNRRRLYEVLRIGQQE
ncbi:MAG: ATP synthase F1 subunit epsilon [Candidatus Zixiibacteriota bacterium]|jgi:F-type H+-transporting ATPase subunit epsilon